jgi:hypothetical protein
MLNTDPSDRTGAGLSSIEKNECKKMSSTVVPDQHV